MLISAGGQVIRTETNTINRYSSGARGVIVMRLGEGDKVVAISAFRQGLADQGAMGDNDDPQPDGGDRRTAGIARHDRLRRPGGRRVRGPVRDLPRQRQPGAGAQDRALARQRARSGRGLPVREREHLRPHPGQRPREGHLPRPADLATREPVDHGAPDHDRRLQAGVRGADHGRDPVLRVRPLGQEGPAARPDHRPPRSRT